MHNIFFRINEGRAEFRGGGGNGDFAESGDRAHAFDGRCGGIGDESEALREGGGVTLPHAERKRGATGPHEGGNQRLGQHGQRTAFESLLEAFDEFGLRCRVRRERKQLRAAGPVLVTTSGGEAAHEA